MAVPVAEILLGITQTVAVLGELKRLYETGTITEEELQSRFRLEQARISQVEELWEDLEKRDAERGAET